jgi:hypothetical protein
MIAAIEKSVDRGLVEATAGVSSIAAGSILSQLGQKLPDEGLLLEKRDPTRITFTATFTHISSSCPANISTTAFIDSLTIHRP